ncbi:MAG: YggT family protein [Pseudomonadota bacterium]
MNSLIMIIALLAQLIFYLVLIQFIIGLLIQFDVLNRRQPLVHQIYNGINALLDPLLAPIRRILPPTGGIDFSPLVLLIGLQILLIILSNNRNAFG